HAAPAAAGRGAGAATAAGVGPGRSAAAEGRLARALDGLLAWLASTGAASPVGASCAALGAFAATELGLLPTEAEAAVSRLLDDGAVYETVENHLRVLEGHGAYSEAAADEDAYLDRMLEDERAMEEDADREAQLAGAHVDPVSGTRHGGDAADEDAYLDRMLEDERAMEEDADREGAYVDPPGAPRLGGAAADEDAYLDRMLEDERALEEDADREAELAQLAGACAHSPPGARRGGAAEPQDAEPRVAGAAPRAG
ncbi:unnamed protein product, partial [Prorocentrum cordatum]